MTCRVGARYILCEKRMDARDHARDTRKHGAMCVCVLMQQKKAAGARDGAPVSHDVRQNATYFFV